MNEIDFTCSAHVLCQSFATTGPYCFNHYQLINRHGTIMKTCRSKHCQSEFPYVSKELNGNGYFCPECLLVVRAAKRKSVTIYCHTITVFDWLELFNSQNGKCKLCNTFDDLMIDHDHRCCPSVPGNSKGGKATRSCGKCIRGLLCRECNTLVGCYEKRRGGLPTWEYIENYLVTPFFQTKELVVIEP